MRQGVGGNMKGMEKEMEFQAVIGSNKLEAHADKS